MTIRPGSPFNTFTHIYSNRFAPAEPGQPATGKIDYKEMSRHFYESIKNKQEIIKDIPNAAKAAKIREYIAIETKILKTVIKAKKHSLSRTFLGSLNKALDFFLYFTIGAKTPLRKLWEMEKFVREVTTESKRECKRTGIRRAVIKSKSRAVLAKAIANLEHKTCSFTIYNKKSSTLFIADPDKTVESHGIVYEAPFDNDPPSGATRYYYKAQAHTVETGENPETVGILSNFHPIASQDLNDDARMKLLCVKNQMHEEFDLLHVLKENDSCDGVIKADAHLWAAAEGTIAGFTVLEHHELGNLKNFIASGAVMRMSRNEKLEFIVSLLNTYKQLHDSGYIHRDTKALNIVVRKEGNKFIYSVIDFVTCILITEEGKKQRYAGTTAYWSPEYNEACLKLQEPKGRLKLQEATSTSIDTWGLGLVFFHFMYGQDLIDDTLDFKKYKGNSFELAKPLAKLHKEILPVFIAEMHPDSQVRNEWKAIKKAIQEDSEIWNRIILPMLTLDPNKRPSTQDLHAWAEKLKAQEQAQAQ